MDENGVTRIAEGQEKESIYKRENEKSWRMTMSKNLRSKILAMIMMMLIVLAGGSGEVSAVVWESAPSLMARGNTTYALGATRAGKTQYTADKIAKIIFSTTVPGGYIADGVWDVSYNDGDSEIVSYLVPSTTVTGLYDQYIVSTVGNIKVSNGSNLFRGYTKVTEIKDINYLDTSDTNSFFCMFYKMESIKNLDLSGFVTTNVTNMSWMFGHCYALESVNLSSFNTAKVTTMEYMFISCRALASLDLKSFITTSVTNMGTMFYDCKALKTLDVSSFNTSKVTNMKEMFYDCNVLEALNLSGFDTSLVTSMQSMFYNCHALKILDLSAFKTANVTHMGWMFYACSGLTNLNLGSNFDTNKVTSMYSMFCDCSSLTSLDLGLKFNTSQITEMYYMFYNCSSLTSLNLGSMFYTNKVTSMTQVFYNCKLLKSLDLSTFDTTNVTSMNSMFNGCSALTTLKLGNNFVTNNVTTMYRMFTNCSSLTTLNLESFNTSQVTEMYSLFKNCSALTSLTLGPNFNTNKVTNMQEIFYNCKSLTTLDISAFDTTNVTTFYKTFAYCSALETITFGEKFYTANVTNMTDMFAACGSLKTIDTSKFNTSKVETFEGIFKGCKALKTLDVSMFDTSSAKCMSSMFDSCTSLKVLDLSNFDTSALDGVTGEYNWTSDGTNLVDTHAFLYGTNNLETLILGEKFGRLDGRSFFYTATGLKRIISLKKASSAEDIMKISTNNYLNTVPNVVLYVPDTTTEKLYEANGTYASYLTSERIEPLIKLNGDNPTNVKFGDTYSDAGVSISGGLSAEELDTLGYTLETESTVNTSAAGSQKITYTLKYKNQVVATETRTVNIVESPKLMLRDGANDSYGDDPTVILGAYRTGKSTYTPDLVSRVIFTTTIPTGYIADGVWDVSYNEGDYAVVSYLVPSTTVTGLYDQYIVANGKIQAPENCGGLFWAYTNMTSIVNFTQLETANVKSMTNMFATCESLETLDLTHFNTKNVTGMGGMFYGCESLTELKIPNFDTTNVTSMNTMFYNCKLLATIDVSHFKTANVIDMRSMFNGCEMVEELDVSGFDTKNVTNMDYMFMYCKKLTTLDVSNFVTTSLEEMDFMFNGCSGLTSLTLGNFTTTNVDEMIYVFNNCSLLTTLDVSSFNTANVTSFHGMFSGCKKLTSLNLGSNFSTANATDMGSMFWWCELLPSITLGDKFTVANATDMSYMFYRCSALTNLDISMMEWTKVISLNSMFESCTQLKQIDFPSKATNAAENVEAIFRNCSALTSIDTRKINVASVKNMTLMFDGCTSLTFLDLTTFNPGSLDDSNGTYKWTDGIYLKNMDGLFNGCTNLETIILATNFSRLDGSYMFDECSSLKNIFVHKTADVASSVMPTAADTSLKKCTNATLYVPNKTTESFYEANEIYKDALTVDRIKPMVDLIGDNPMKVIIGDTFIDPGAVVLGYDDNDLSELETMLYTYNVTTPTISTSAEGTYEITYTLSFKYSSGNTVAVATEKRTVNVREMPVLMVRDGTTQTKEIMLGAYRAEKTTYTANLVDRIVFSKNIPSGYISDGVWDVSFNEGDNEIISYLVPSTTRNGFYDQYIVADSMILAPDNSAALFEDYVNMTSILNIEQLDTSNVTSMKSMFSECNSLKELNLNNFNTSNVTDMFAMFYNCNSLSKLEVNNFDTRKVKDMYCMFWGCARLTKLNLDSFDTTNITTMASMFSHCTKLEEINMSNFNTINVTDMYAMFFDCESLTELNLNGFNTSNVEDMGYMFNNCSNLENLSLSNFNTDNVTYMRGMFYGCKSLEELDISNFNVSRVTDIGYMFADMSSLKTLDLSGFDTSEVTIMESMFKGCTSLTSLNISSFDTTKVTSMEKMFQDCTGLTKLDINHFNTQNVTNMSDMFDGCTSLNELKITEITTENVTTASGMFKDCNSLTTLMLGTNFDKINGENMFSGTDNLTRVISLRKNMMTFDENNGITELDTRVLYVPDKNTEKSYEDNTALTEEQVESIMTVAGENPIAVEGGSTYGVAEDEGVSVLDWSESDATNYNNLGFTTTTSGLPVNTNTPDDKAVTYSLYYNGNLMDTQQRMVEIEGGNYLVGENYYKTLKEAIDAVSSTGTIYVMKDNEDASNAVIPDTKNIVLDLGNATITKIKFDEMVRGIINHGTLTIKGDGTIQTEEADVNDISSLIYNAGTLNVESGTLINKGILDGQWITVFCTSDSIININGGTLDGTLSEGVSATDWCRVIYLSGKNIEVNIANGTLINTKNSGWLIEAYENTESINCENCVINISGGIFDSAWGITVNSVKNDTDINITGGTFSNIATGIHVANSNCSADVLIENAVIESKIGYAINNFSTINNVTVNNSKIKSNSETLPTIYSATPNTTIGTKDGDLIGTTPIIQGTTAIEAPNGFNFYDGILLGKSEAHTGTVLDVAPNCEVSYSEYTLNDETYKAATLGTYLMKRDYAVDANGIPSAAYVLGAEEAGMTQYTADKIESITINTLSNLSIDMDTSDFNWDVSEVQNGGIKIKLTDYDDNGMYEMQIYSFGDILVHEDGLEMLFADYPNCESISGIDGLVVKDATTMYGTFLNDAKLKNIDISSVDTSKVTTFESTFDGCEALTSLNLGDFNTGSMTTTKAMFRDCKELGTLSVSDWRMTNVIDMSSMFENCANIAELDVKDWNTSAAQDMSQMFKGCELLVELNLKDWNTSNVNFATGMFENCKSLEYLNLLSFDFTLLEGASAKDNMFANCSNLEMISFNDQFNGINGTNMFKDCTALATIIMLAPITDSSDALELTTTTGLSELTKPILYVTDPDSEGFYENVANYNTTFGEERIKPLLELVGETRSVYAIGGTYREEGYKVANKDIAELEALTIEGFDVEIKNVDKIDFSTMGIYFVDYTLTYTNPQTDIEAIYMTLTREIQVGEIKANVYITGKNEFDSTLTVEIGESSIDESLYTYQWYTNDVDDIETGTPIPGATNASYTIQQGLIGKYIYVELIGRQDGFEDTKIYDITDDGLNLSATVMKKVFTEPTSPNNYTYNGSEQTFDSPVFEEKYMTVSGNKGTNAGVYTATFALKMKDDCEWSTRTTDDVVVNWEISPKAIAVIWDTDTDIIYNGTEQAPEVYGLTGIDGETAVLKRTTQVDAGRYVSQATIDSIVGGNERVENYTLINDRYSYEILKAEPTFRVTPTNLTLTDGNSGYLNYETNVESAITIVSDNQDVAVGGEVNSDNKTIEIISTGSGSTVLTITLEETVNYNASSVTVTVGSIEANYTDGRNYYETLSIAFSNTADGETITVLKDVIDGTVAELEAGKTVTLNLNNRKITVNMNKFIVVKGTLNIESAGSIVAEAGINTLVAISGGTLTTNNGVQLEGYNATVVNNSGTFNMNGGSLKNKNATSDSPVLFVAEGATANISAGNITASSLAGAILNEGTTNVEYLNELVGINNSTKSGRIITNRGEFVLNGASTQGEIANENGDINIANSTLYVESDGDDSAYEYAVKVVEGNVTMENITMTGYRLLNISDSDTVAKLSNVSAITTDAAIVVDGGELHMDKESNIKSSVTTLNISGTAEIKDSAIETTSTSANDSAIHVNAAGVVTAENTSFTANTAKAIKNEGTLDISKESNIVSAGTNTVLNDGTLTIKDSTLKNNRTDGGVTIDNNGTATLTASEATSNGNVVDNSGTIDVVESQLTSVSGLVMNTTNVANVHEGSVLSGATGIENTGTLTLGAADGNVHRDTITVDTPGRAINNENVFNWYDGQIKGNASVIYLGNAPIVEESVAIAIETEGTMETRYVVKDMENPVIENIISETDWVKNSQTLQVVARDNVRIDGYAITETNEKPAVDSNIWSNGNTFSVTENKSYFIWVKDNAGNITGEEFIAKWVCKEIWDTTGSAGSETRAILCLDGTLLFEVADRTKGIDEEATGEIKDYTISSAPWTNDARVTGIRVQEGITKIGAYGISNARTATFVSIPASVTQINQTALYRTNNYGSLTVNAGNPNFIGEENAIYDKEKTIIYSYSPTNNSTVFTMPDTVETVVPGLFYENTTSQEIYTSKNITSVGADAFEFVTADVYYYTSSYEMHTYAQNNETEAHFIPIDNVPPVVESFIINNNDTAATTVDVTLEIVVTDDIEVDSIFASETYYTDEEMRYLDTSYWTEYSGTEYPFVLTSNYGTKYVYLWAKDITGNISQVAEDYIYYGDVAFELYGQKDIVQYVDESGRDYYKYLEDVQGGSTQIDKITIDVTGSVDHRNIGIYPIVYSVTIDGTLMQSKTRTVEVIANTWNGATGTTADGFGYIIHSNGKYAKITSYTGSVGSTINIPATVTHNGVEFKVIDVGSTLANTNILGNSSNTSVTNVVLPDTIINIGEYAFYGFAGLQNINIPSATMSISSYAFENAGTTSGISMVLPANFRELKTNALYGARVSSMDFGNTLRHIAENAFAKVSVPSEFIMELPASLDAIGTAAFESTRIYDINIDENNSKYKLDSSGMALLTADGETLVIYPIASPFEEYVADEGVKTIGIKAFKEADTLKVINLPDTLTTIGDSAFEGATDAHTITNVKLATTIGEYAFANSSLDFVELHRSLAVIEKGTFENTNIEFVRVPLGVNYIREDAFKGITTLKSAVIESKPTMSSNAFGNCTNLEFIMIGSQNGVAAIADTTAIPQNTVVYVPSSMEVLYEGDSVYMGYSNYTEKIKPILKLIGDAEITCLVNIHYVESGVELMEETFTVPGNSSKVDGLELVIEGSVDVTKSERTVINYIAMYKGTEVNRITRTVDVEDYELPIINNVTTDSDWVSPKQTFVVDATDNIGVTHYIITEENTVPSLDDSRWQTSSSLKVGTNGVWYIFVKDGAGNISERREVVASWVAAGKWDVSKKQDNTVHAIVTLDEKKLIIKGVGETKDYAENATPWLTDYADTIETITVENGVTSIGNYLLGYLPNVVTINLSNTVTKVVDGAFAYTNEFTAMNLNGNTNLSYSEGTLYNAARTELYVHTNKYTTDYAIPSSVTKICVAAFANSIYVSNFDLTNVVEIQSYAFNQCLHMTNQYIPKTLEKIGKTVFAGARGPIYYYSSCETMMDYVSTYGTESNFVEIDDIIPVIKNFSINNNEAITNNANVTLQIEASDNKAVSKIIIETTLSQNLTSSDSRWTAYNGETEMNYTLPNTNGIVPVYAWVMDTSNNISLVAGDSIVLGENDFSLEYNDTIVQYIDKTSGNYYKFNEEVQGKYFVTTPGFTVTVNSNIDVKTVGEKQVVYKLSFNGTEAGEFYKTVDVIEDAWGTEVFTENGFSFVKHSSKNYAKIVKYTASNTVTFPSAVTNNGVSYKVIEVESLDSNPVVNTTVTSVTLPNTIISIGKNAFVGCTSLNNIDLKENVMTIEENAFKNSGLTTLDLKLNVREVKESAFENAKITTFNNSKLLKSVETKAFRNALNITKLVIPNDIYNIDEHAFGGSIIDELAFATAENASRYSIVEEKILVENATNTLLQYVTGSSYDEVEITKNNIAKIGAGAFMNAENLTKLVIKAAYTEMGEEAFRNTKLEVFEVSEQVKDIPEYAFADSKSLQVLVLSGATSIAGNAVEGNTALRTLALLTNELCEIDDTSKLSSSTNVYVLNENKYKVSSYWSTIANRIFEIFRLNGDSYVTTEAGFDYEELGVYAMDEIFKVNATYPEFDNISIEIIGTIDTSKLGEQTITYKLKYKSTVKSEINRIVDVVDTIAPRIDNVNTVNEMQVSKERFTVIASDNHKIAGYALTQDAVEPLLTSNVWTTSNILHATVNGTWYVWVKDEAGNVSKAEVEATNICTERWDIGVIPNTVFAVITSDNCLLIEGVGEVKYYDYDKLPWANYFEAIRKVEVKEGVTKLREYTLGKLTNVTSLSLPSTLVKVATSTFGLTNNFNEVVFPNGTDTFVYENNNLYSADKTILYVHSNKDITTEYTINENVKVIAEYAFANNSNIVKVITNSNPSLLQGAFYNVSTLENISGDIGGTNIDAYAFAECKKLEGIEFSEDLEIIGPYAFSNCNMITKIELIMCTKLKTLEHHAFADLHNLKEMKIYRYITRIYDDGNGNRNVFENMGSNFVENAKVYYFEGCTAMEDYAKNYADVNVDFILIDELGPRVEKLTVINQDSGMYAAGTVLEIVAEMTEEFVTYKGTIPSLSIAFGNGRAIALGEGQVDGKQLKYTYMITTEDFGELKCVSFTGELYDSLDNMTVFNSPETFDKEIVARTGVQVDSDHEETKYFTTLKAAADYITVGGKVTMLLDEEVQGTSTFKANTLVSLDINGKKVTFNSKEKNTLIINRGVLNITDSGAGALSIVGNESGEVTAISNEGTLTIVNGIVRAQGSGDVTSYGVYNEEYAKLTITGGSVEGINNTGMSYGVVNSGDVRMEGGNIQSSTVEGKTYGLYNLGTTNMINGQIAARISSGTKGETIAVYIESGKFVVGNGDETINPDNPIIYSTKDGLINDGGTLEFYDGFIEGQAYRSLSTDNVKVVPGFALIRKLIGNREKAMLDYDIVKPTIKLTNLTPDWTNKSVTIEAHFIDEESGILNAEYKGEKLELVNNKATIETFENGTFTFKATDFAGNVTEESIEIKNIDRQAPTFEDVSYEALANDKEVTFKVTIKDDAAGVYGYSLTKFDSEPTTWTKLEKILTESNITEIITTNGRYYLYAIDDAGNISQYGSEINITNVDANAPKITSLEIEDEGRGFANSSTVIINVEAEDDTGITDILLSNSMLTNNEVMDSEDWVPYSETVIWDLTIGDGEKIVYVWVRDRVGRISRSSTVSTKLLAQYIGNNGTNSTSYKMLIKDGNYNFNSQLTASDVSIKVKSGGTATYTGAAGSGVTLTKAPIVYGPVLEGTQAMNGRYYFLETKNIEGNGTVYICLKNTAEVDKAGNQIPSGQLEVATDVTIELNAPIITIGNTQISVYDADNHVINVLRVNGKTVELKNGVITRSELETEHGITLTSGTVLEAFDKCGNTAKHTIS